MKRSPVLAIFLLASAFPNATLAQNETKPPVKPGKTPSPPEGVVIDKDVAYLPAERKEKADLYLPAKRGKDVRSPAVVIIHGGGWTSGDKGAKREFNIGTTLA